MTITLQRPRLLPAASARGCGDHLTVTGELLADLGPRLVAAAGVRPGERVLDVAAATGLAAVPAALAGASVTACEPCAELIALGRVDAAIRGADLEWEVAGPGCLPYGDGTFDTALSCLGPADADELLRVVRPGGTIAVLAWTPDGVGGRLDPEGARWGDPARAAELLGDRVTGLTVTQETLHVRRFTSGAQFADYLRAFYWPVVAEFRAADDPGALAAELAGLAERAGVAYGLMGWDYVVLTARRAA